MVAEGRAALGVQLISEIVSVDGVELVGPLPDPLQSVTELKLVIASESEGSEATRKFIAFVTSDTARQVIAAKGMTAP